MIVDQLVTLDLYAMPTGVSGLHLSVQDTNGKRTARVMPRFGVEAEYEVTFQPDVALTSPGVPGPWLVDGPMLLSSSQAFAQLGDSTYRKLAFALDEQGMPGEGVGRGFDHDQFTDCTQPGASGGYFGMKLHASVDSTPPSLIDQTKQLPWDTRLPLSEPAEPQGEPVVTGATLLSLEAGPNALVPRFGDVLSLLGKTVTLSFPQLKDRAGNAAPASASITFSDLGDPKPAFDFSSPESPCTGPALAPRVAFVLSKPGATKAKLTLCPEYGPSQFGHGVTIKAWSSAGASTSIESVVTSPTSVLIDLPADTVALDFQAGGGCGSVRLGPIEAM